MDPCADFDQTGFAWPRAPVAPAVAPGQGQLFADDYAQPDAPASDPVFWAEPARPVRPDDQSPFYADADPADPLAGDFPRRRTGVCLNLFKNACFLTPSNPEVWVCTSGTPAMIAPPNGKPRLDSHSKAPFPPQLFPSPSPQPHPNPHPLKIGSFSTT